MGLSNSGWTACTNGTCRCTGRALAAIRDNPSDLNHLPLDHATRHDASTSLDGWFPHAGKGSLKCLTDPPKSPTSSRLQAIPTSWYFSRCATI